MFSLGLRTLKLVGLVCFHLFFCLLWATEMGSLCVSAVLCCQGLACVVTVFLHAVWNRLLVVKVFPKYIYVKPVRGQITISTKSNICCVVTRLTVSYCCRFA